MKCLCVFLILFAAFSLQARGTAIKRKRQAIDPSEHGAIQFNDAIESDESTESDLTERHFGSAGNWGKKPGGWQKGPCGKPGKPPCPDKPKPKPNPLPNDEIEESTKPFKPTEPTTIETRPTFATTDATPATKPTPKPTSPTKPTPIPTSPTKPTPIPISPTKPTPIPTSPTEPTHIPTSPTKPTPIPTSPTKPTPIPTSPTKPTQKPNRPAPCRKPNKPVHGSAIVFPGDDDETDCTPWSDFTPKPVGTPKPSPPPDHDEVVPERDAPSKEEIDKCMRGCKITVENEPVCGNNGVTYINLWHFGCAKRCGIEVELLSKGSCPVPPAKPCITDPNVPPSAEAVKQCIRKCPVTMEFNPVCGTDGVTYSNPGRLNCAKKCGVVVYLLSRGPCSGSTSDTTPPIDETHEPATPSSDEIKQCMQNCPVTSEYAPVCGSDGRTYTNPGRFNCAKECGVDVYMLTKGPCRASPPATKPPTTGRTSPSFIARACLERCPVLPDYNPVCGTDYVTYGNPGKLFCAQYCGSDVKLLGKGPCPGKEQTPGSNDTLENEKDPELEKPATPAVTPATPSPSVTPSSVARECMRTCPSTPEYNPVCGTDYVTYNNPGKLHCAQVCGVDVKMLRPGPCPKNPPTPTPTPPPTPTSSGSSVTPSSVARECMRTCPSTPEYNPVCGTDYVTYNNPGKLHCAQVCGVDVKMLRPGPCPKNPPTPTPTPAPTPTSSGSSVTPSSVARECMRTCPSTPEYNPVCGTDNVTYNNAGKLLCAEICGVAVNMLRPGPCPKRPVSSVAPANTTPMTPAA